MTGRAGWRVAATTGWVLLITGCAPIGDTDGAGPQNDGEVSAFDEDRSDDDPADNGSEGDGAADDGSSANGSDDELPAGRDLPDVSVDGQQVVLDGPRGSHALAELDPEEGMPRSAAMRPNDATDATDSDLTVAVVVESAIDPGPRYVLRYLHLDGGTSGDPDAAGDGAAGPVEFTWLPWRLQIDADHGHGRDVPPTLVWAPDGHRLAWIEWNEGGSVLRLLDWSDDGPIDSSRSPLADVPPGVELDGWVIEDGESVLLGERDGEPYRFELRELAHEPEMA